MLRNVLALGSSPAIQNGSWDSAGCSPRGICGKVSEKNSPASTDTGLTHVDFLHQFLTDVDADHGRGTRRQDAGALLTAPADIQVTRCEQRERSRIPEDLRSQKLSQDMLK